MLLSCKEQESCSVCPHYDSCRVRQCFYENIDVFYNMFRVLSNSVITSSKMLGRSDDETERILNELLRDLVKKRNIELDESNNNK